MTLSALHTSPASLALREVADHEPDRPAIEIDDFQLSYGELNEQADRLANRLANEFGSGHDRVALRANGTHELAVGFLGIQRAGMVSVPIDPTAPPERVQSILADVEPSLLLTDVNQDGSLDVPGPIASPLEFGETMDARPIDRERGELVSIIYTSGSTGTPKGIMLAREQMNNWFAWLARYDLPRAERMGCLATGTVGIIEGTLGSVLLRRATLVAYEIRSRGINALGPWLERAGVETILVFPTVMRQLLPTLSPDQRFSSLRLVVLAGETATWEDVARLRPHLSPEAVISNQMGLTEGPGIARCNLPSDAPLGQGPLPIGHPPADLDLAILDPDGQPVADGEPGEIVVRSDCLALGYWRRPDLTRAAFRDLGDGRRELRTGDGGRLLADGTLEHLGRLDHVVKISGNRVELGEVEAALTGSSGVEAALAAPWTDESQSVRLAACVVPTAGRQLDPRVLRATLARRLPGYMVPHRIAIVDQLPRLSGGKVDRPSVAAAASNEALLDGGPAGDPAVGELERALAGIWREILEVERVDRQDDFFSLGGDSLDASRMFFELDHRLGIDRPVSLLAEAPTLASLARLLNEQDPGWGALLAVRSEGTRPPLFVVHGGAGNVLYARGLVTELDADRPIYGVRCDGLSGTPIGFETLEEVAASYVQRIQALYPHGPYLLYGVSLGGVIAMEMARQLLEQGEEVPLVFLGDSALPGAEVSPTSAERLRVHRRTLGELDLASKLHYAVGVVERQLEYRRELASRELRLKRRDKRRLERTLKRGEPVPVYLRTRYVTRQYGRLMRDHQPRPPFPEQTCLLRAGGPGDLPERGWGSLLGDTLQIVDVPGTHVGLGWEASGAYVGPVIAHALERLDQTEPARARSCSAPSVQAAVPSTS